MRPWALGTVALLLLAPAAWADDPTPSPTGLAPESPLVVTVTDLRPRAPRPGDAFEVVGTVRNDGPVEVTSVSLRLRVGDRIDSRGGLHDADQDRPVTVSRPGTTVRLPEPLQPGQTARFDLRTTVAALKLGGLGVYPLDLEARGSVGRVGSGKTEQLGLAPTWVPWFGSDPVRRTHVAVVWPLVDNPRQEVDGTFRDDSLATSLSADGRLGRLLAAARAAESPECGGPPHDADGVATAAPTRCEAVPVTYAVDPDLLFAAESMRSGYRIRTGPSSASKGAGGPAADAFLTALTQAAGPGEVLALPYADPDVTALTRSGSGFDQDLARAGALAGTEVKQALRVDPITGVAWPPTGPVSGAALNAYARGGAKALVLDPSAYGQPDSEPARTPGARTLLPASDFGSAVDGLVLEPYLSDLVTGLDTGASGSRLAEQRFLAETAIIAAERPQESRTLLIAPARRGDVDVRAAFSALRDLGRVPWLCPVRLSAVVAATDTCADEAASGMVERADRGALSTNRTEGLSSNYLTLLGKDRAVADQLTGAVLSDEPTVQPDVAKITGQLRRAFARAESSAWREDAATARQQAALLHRHLLGLVDDVTVYGGQVLLTSTSGRLQASLENRLSVPIRVRLRFDGGSAIDPVMTGIIEVTPGNAVPASVPVQTRKSGQYVVKATVLDRTGAAFPLGANPRTDDIVVRSTGYGRLALAVTIGGAGVLFVAAGFRIFRRARASRP